MPIALESAIAAEISYIYDELGRLKAVVDPATDTAVYNYDAVGNLLTISRQSSSTVSIIEFAPKSGPVGTTVTIYGTGFSTTPSQNTVQFNGVTAPVTSSTENQIITTVPSTATTGAIGLTAPGGSGSSAQAFVVTSSTGAPTITSFTPTIGTPGTVVTVNGTNFETTPSKNNLRFNISPATISSSTSDTITTSVPTGTGSGRITVKTVKGTALSTNDFFIPPAPYGVADVEFTGRMSIDAGNFTATITTANKIALVVFDGAAGQRVSFSASAVTISGSSVNVYAPNTTLLSSKSVATNGGFIDLLVLPSTGTYAILVDPNGTSTGSMRAKDAAGTPRCQYCGTELGPKSGRPNSYEADHRVPYSRGGPSTPANLTPSCRTCNRSKGAQMLEEWGGR
jgi:YD repeat-containing protein